MVAFGLQVIVNKQTAETLSRRVFFALPKCSSKYRNQETNQKEAKHPTIKGFKPNTAPWRLRGYNFIQMTNPMRRQVQ